MKRKFRWRWVVLTELDDDEVGLVLFKTEEAALLRAADVILSLHGEVFDSALRAALDFASTDHRRLLALWTQAVLDGFVQTRVRVQSAKSYSW